MKDEEFRHQCALFQWWAYACKGYGLPEFALMAYPAGGLRHKSTAGKLKASGTRRGIPDVLLPVARGNFHGLAIELKSQSGRQTDQQKVVLPWFASVGWRVEVAYSSEAAIGAIKDYLRQAPARAQVRTITTITTAPQQIFADADARN